MPPPPFRDASSTRAMALFAPYRALGLVNAQRGCALVVKRRGTETFVTVSAEDAFAVYDARKLTLVFRSARFATSDARGIGAMAVRKDYTFCAIGREIRCAKRLAECCEGLGRDDGSGHDARVTTLHAFGRHLASVDENGAVKMWDIDDDAMRARERAWAVGRGEPTGPEGESDSELERGARAMEMPRTFAATTVCHPDGYVDKLLFGSSDGRLALMNVRAGKLVHEFAGWGSAVTALENSPATDVVAVGLADGRVLLVNVLEDKVLFTLTPERGVKVTALAFRTDDQDDVLCVGDETGRVTVWDLEKRSLRTLIVQCHEGPVVSLKFLDGQPVMVSSGFDNTLKEWIFDREDGDARLLRFRAGHSKPPTSVSFYGEGKKLLAAGSDRTLRFFHAFRDQQNIELSQKNVSKRAKKIGVAEEELKLSPVTKMAWGELRERDWANVVTAHEGSNKAYTWRISKGALGEHILQCPKDDGKCEVKSVAISACGNFAFLGAANGAIHRFNLQSGAHRGAFERVLDADEVMRTKKKKNGNEGYNFPGGKRSFWALANQTGGNAEGKLRVAAHDGEVTCIQAHCANRSVVTAGVDGMIRVWKFSELKIDLEIDVGCGVRCGHLHEDSLLVVGCADKHVRVYDTMTGKRVRTFKPRGQENEAGDITSVQISENGKWIFVLDTTGTIRVYDIPAARLIQHMILGADKVTAMSFSPRMDFLATVHENRVGLYLWVNMPMFDYDTKLAYGRKVSIALPRKHAESDADGGVRDASEETNKESNDTDVYIHPFEEDEEEEHRNLQELEEYFKEMATGPKQIAPGMITLAMMPQTQIEMLLNLETVQAKSKVKTDDKEPELAPFFLPTAAASDDVRRSVFDPARESELNAKDDTGDDDSKAPKSRILRQGADLAGASATPLLTLILRGERSEDYTEALEFLKNASIHVVDAELRSLGPWDHKFMSEDDVKTLRSAIKFFTAAIASGMYYEMVNAQLNVFLNVHTTAIMQSSALVDECHALREAMHKSYSRIDDLFNEIRCTLSFHIGDAGV